MVSEIEWYLESRTEHVPFQNKANDGAMVAGYTDDVFGSYPHTIKDWTRSWGRSNQPSSCAQVRSKASLR